MATMKILAITDLHGNDLALEAILRAAGSVAMVLLGGDVTNFGSPKDAARLVEAVRAGGAALWAVSGNCDSPEIDQRLADLGVGLHGRGVIEQGIVLHGLSAAPPWMGGRMYELTEDEMSAALGTGYREISAAPAAPHILLTHCPPRGCRLDRTRFFSHVGSTAVRAFVEETHPALVVCGHIHESRGIDRLGQTLIVNCGAAKAGCFAMIEVPEEGGVKVELART